MQETFQLPVARAYRLAGAARATWYRKSAARDQSALPLRIRELVLQQAQAFGVVNLEPRGRCRAGE